jgi:hypothetical protein
MARILGAPLLDTANSRVCNVHWAKAHQTRVHRPCACGQYTRQAYVWQAAPHGAPAFPPMAKARGTQPGVLVERMSARLVYEGCGFGGPDGVPCREFDTVPNTDSAQTAPEVPAYFPVHTILSKRTIASALRARRLPSELWPEIRRRATHESLRRLAEDFGVSHEAIRRIVTMKSARQSARRRRSA